MAPQTDLTAVLPDGQMFQFGKKNKNERNPQTANIPSL